MNSTASRQATAVCPAGARIDSGGFDLGSGRGQVNPRTFYLGYDLPTDPFRQGFRDQAQEDATGYVADWPAAAYAICG